MPGSADRNDPDVLAAISTNCCPVPPFNLSYHQEARLVFATSGRLQHPRIVPQHMRFIKFGAMTLFAALLSGPCSNVARPHDVETISVQSNPIQSCCLWKEYGFKHLMPYRLRNSVLTSRSSPASGVRRPRGDWHPCQEGGHLRGNGQSCRHQQARLRRSMLEGQAAGRTEEHRPRRWLWIILLARRMTIYFDKCWPTTFRRSNSAAWKPMIPRRCFKIVLNAPCRLGLTSLPMH